MSTSSFLARPAARLAGFGAIVAAGTVAACRDATSVPDLNGIPASTIQGTLTPANLPFLTTGVLNNDRANYSFTYLVFGETLGLDIYNLDPAEPRYISNLLGRTTSPSNFIGAGSWTGWYNNILTINTGLQSLAADTAGLGAQAPSTRGFFRTIKALELYNVWALRGQNGIVIQPSTLSQKTPGPIVCQQTALAYISSLLDSAYTDLQAGGSSATFAFNFPAGFSSNGTFNTPTTFAQFNRALKGRAEVYRGILGNAASYQNALTAFGQSFVPATGSVTSADLTNGIYYTYSTAANEQVNPLAVPTIALSNMVGDSLQAGDARSSKISTTDTVGNYGLSTPYSSPLASTANLTTAIPLLRGAEVVLLRAQAEIGAGNLAAATTDINAVRTIEGGLPAYTTFANASAAINALLYEKRYSLLLSGPQRLVDLRAYNRLGANGPANFPYLANDSTLVSFLGATPGFQNALPIPQGEIDARGGNVSCQGS